jgi:hypothetical protein
VDPNGKESIYPDIWRLYEGLQFKQVESRYSIQRKDRWVSFDELIITNF